MTQIILTNALGFCLFELVIRMINQISMRRLPLVAIITLIPLACLLAAFMPRPANDLGRYHPGDWVSYGVSRFVSSVAVSPQEAFFGTTSGIARYDILRGRWKPPYTTSDGLAGNLVSVVGYDRITGFLWCATEHGLSRQHPASLRWTNYSFAEIGIPPGDEILSIGFDERANWFETRTRLFRQDKYGSIIMPVDNPVEGSDPTIEWFGLRSPPQREPLPHFFMPAGYLFEPGGTFPNPRSVRNLGAVQDNRLRRASVTSVISDDWGNMWLGTWGLGAMRADLNVDRAELLPFGLANRRVDALLFDDEGLWIGGLNTELTNPFEESIQGITFWANPRTGAFSDRDWRYFEARNNLEISSDEVNEFAIHQNKLYCATEYGVVIYDRRKDRWRRLLPTDGLADERVNDVLAYEGALYAATDLGLNRIVIETIGRDSLAISEVAPDQMRHVRILDLEQQQNLMWIATERGPFIYDMARSTGGYLADNEGPRDEITVSISFSDSVVWIGTDYGVEAFDVVHERWLPAPARQRFVGSQINCIKAGPQAVWVGTQSGVFKYNRELQTWRQYTTEDGLLDNHVYAVALDDDLVWFGTEEGLTVFRWQAFHNFD